MKTLFPATLLTAILLTGCSGGGSTSSSADDSTRTETVSIPFEALANGTAIDCDTTLTGLGLAGTDADLLDFRFYLHDIALTTDAGRTLALNLDANAWQHSGVALVDFQDKADSCSGDAKDTHKSVTGTVELEEGESVNGVQFNVGLPSSLNHQNPTTASSPMNITSLSWGWQVGYKFMRLDVAPVGGVTRPTDGTYNNTAWNLHLGSTDCAGDPQLGEEVTCGRNNRPSISLAGFEPGTDTIVIDYGALVANANIGQDEAGAPGCMSGSTDPECDPIFTALGMDLAAGAMDDTLTQTVFRLK